MIIVLDRKRRFKVEYLYPDGDLLNLYSTGEFYMAEEAVQNYLDNWGHPLSRYGMPDEEKDATFIVTDLTYYEGEEKTTHLSRKFKVAIKATYGWSCKQICMPEELK